MQKQIFRLDKIFATACCSLLISSASISSLAAAQVDPTTEAQQHLVAGTNAASEGDWQAALKEFLAAAAVDEHSDKALYHVGVAYYHLGRLEQARVAELLAIQANPKLLAAYVELSTIETKLGQYSEARSTLIDAQKLGENIPELAESIMNITKLEQRHRALSPLHGEQPVEVSPMAKSALLFNAKDIVGLMHESETALRLGDLKRAKNVLGMAIKVSPENPEPHWRMCQLLEAEGRTNEAIAEAQRAVALDETNPQWYLVLGWTYSRAGKWQQSFEAFKEAYKRDNNLHDAIVGECYALAKQKQIMLARITLHVSDPGAHDTSWYHAANALILEEKGDLKEAYKEITRAAEIAPNDYQVKYTLARVAYQLACTEKTKERWKQAEQHERDLLAVTPYDIEVLINLGICLSAAGEKDAAIKTLAKAAAISPTNASAHAAYASVLAAAGKVDEARFHAHVAKKLNPSDKMADSVLRRLK